MTEYSEGGPESLIMLYGNDQALTFSLPYAGRHAPTKGVTKSPTLNKRSAGWLRHCQMEMFICRLGYVNDSRAHGVREMLVRSVDAICADLDQEARDTFVDAFIEIGNQCDDNSFELGEGCRINAFAAYTTIVLAVVENIDLYLFVKTNESRALLLERMYNRLDKINATFYCTTDDNTIVIQGKRGFKATDDPRRVMVLPPASKPFDEIYHPFGDDPIPELSSI